MNKWVKKKNMSTLNPTALNKVKRTKSKFPPVVYVYTTTPFFLLYFTPFFLLYFTLLLFFPWLSLSPMSHRFSRKKQPNRKRNTSTSAWYCHNSSCYFRAHQLIPLSHYLININLLIQNKYVYMIWKVESVNQIWVHQGFLFGSFSLL